MMRRGQENLLGRWTAHADRDGDGQHIAGSPAGAYGSGARGALQLDLGHDKTRRDGGQTVVPRHGHQVFQQGGHGGEVRRAKTDAANQDKTESRTVKKKDVKEIKTKHERNEKET